MITDTASSTQEASSLHSPGSVAVVGEDGWRSAGEPPNTDRFVEIAWEDGSHGSPTLGFYDGIAEIPDSGRRWWWEWSKQRGFNRITLDGAVLAWRERQNDQAQRPEAARLGLRAAKAPRETFTTNPMKNNL